MAGFRLIRRRKVWVPTLYGWLALTALTVALVLTAGRLIHPFLSPNAPVAGARLLVVEGWLSTKALDQAIDAYRQGKYQQIVTTGGPAVTRPDLAIEASYAELAARYLQSQGLEEVKITAVPAPASAQDRTFLSAVMVRRWIAAQGLKYDALNLFSEGTHARRSHRLYRAALGPEVEIGILAAHPSGYDPARWWQTSTGAKAVIGETIGWLWTVCCFRPPQVGSHEELWAVPSSGKKRPKQNSSPQ